MLPAPITGLVAVLRQSCDVAGHQRTIVKHQRFEMLPAAFKIVSLGSSGIDVRKSTSTRYLT